MSQYQVLHSAVSSFVALLCEHDIRTAENIGARAAMAIEFRDAADDAGVVLADVGEFARDFAAEVYEELRARRAKVSKTVTVRISEAKRIYVAHCKGNRDARKVYEGKLTVVAFLQSLSGKRKGSKGSKVSAKAFAKVMRKMLARVERSERADALAALAAVVRKSRTTR